jgi:DNA-directed RNA polymerase specialized sigma24 family protein
MNCNEIPEKIWKETRQTLFFYFSRRFGFDDAGDLAQETILRILSRPDYTFDDMADFPKICLGFARNVAHEYRRKAAEWVTVDWEDELSNAMQYGSGAEGAEKAVLLRETLEASQTLLNKQERKLIQKATARDAGGAPAEPMAPAARVRLSRARQKLAAYIGWKKK